MQVFVGGVADCCSSVPEGEAVVDEAEGVEEARMLGGCQVSVFVMCVINVGI